MSKNTRALARRVDRHHKIRMAKSLGYPNFHIRFDDGREVILNVEKLIDYNQELYSPLKTVPGLFEIYNVDEFDIGWDYYDFSSNRGKCIRLDFADGRQFTCKIDNLIKYRQDSPYSSRDIFDLLCKYPIDELLGYDLSEFGYPENDIEWWNITDGIECLAIEGNLAYKFGTEVKPKRRFPMICRHGKRRKN